MHIVVRTDGRAIDGLGHVRRCLTLAQRLRAGKVDVRFLLDGNGAASEWIARCGFAVRRASPFNGRMSEVLIVDSYRLEAKELNRLRRVVHVVVVIDDLERRELPAHLVVNSAPGAERLACKGWEMTRYLLGPRYALLRPEFALTPKRRITNQVRRVLIMMGGGDLSMCIPRLMRWTLQTLESAHLDVVVGPLVRTQAAIVSEAHRWPDRVMVHQDPPDVRGLMLATDLALCAGGQTTYELAATGTPAIAIRVAENQTRSLKGLACAGTLAWVGDGDDRDLAFRVKRALWGLAHDPARRNAMSRQGRALIDGQGTDRVANAVLAAVERS